MGVERQEDESRTYVVNPFRFSFELPLDDLAYFRFVFRFSLSSQPLTVPSGPTRLEWAVWARVRVEGTEDGWGGITAASANSEEVETRTREERVSMVEVGKKEQGGGGGRVAETEKRTKGKEKFPRSEVGSL